MKKIYGFLVLGLLSIPFTSLLAASTPALTPNQTAAVMGIVTNFILDNEGLSTIEELAIEKIKAYATSNGVSASPTIQDYIDAGVIGINNSNVADMNEIVGNLGALEVDTKEELQILADALGVILPKKIVSFRNVPVITDGTISGTKYLVDPHNTPNHMRTYLISSNNELSTYTVNGITFFFAIDNVHGAELWKTNGTPTGTEIVKDIFTGTSYGIASPRLVGIGDNAYFVATSTGTFPTYSVFKSDGTDAGTVPVFDYYGGSTALAAIDDMLYFRQKEPTTGFEPWISDGTNGGNIIKDIAFYSISTHTIASSYPNHFTSYKNKVYFHAQYYDTTDNSISTYALHSTDGSTNGTSHVSDMAIINEKMVECGGFLYFSGHKNSGEERKLWKSDGSNIGTTAIDVTAGKIAMPSKLTCVNDRIYFLGKDSNNISGLWKSNGISSTTSFVKNIDGIADMKPAGDKLIAITGTEIWVSDGTSSGTVKLDILDSGIYSITPLTDKRVLISSYSGLWVTDGTLAGSKELLARP